MNSEYIKDANDHVGYTCDHMIRAPDIPTRSIRGGQSRRRGIGNDDLHDACQIRGSP